MANGVIKIRGKGKIGFITPRLDTLRSLDDYWSVRSPVLPDDIGTPMFTAVGNYMPGHRMSRNGIRDVVDSYLKSAGLKKEGLSCHCLRHTCASILYDQTKDAKIVQDTLRHNDPGSTNRYIHLIGRRDKRYTEAIPLKI